MPRILSALQRAYPEARCSLNSSNPLELLVATMLSAQCADRLVNQVTPEVFKKYRTAKDYASADLAELERDLARINFYRGKAKHIQSAARILVERFGGQVPRRTEDLLELPGVARKTANVVLGNAFHEATGIVVDTHVMRVSQRVGLTQQTDRDKIERDLMLLVPKGRWISFGHQMIFHGRYTCTARSPKCAQCPLGEALCPSYQAAAGAPPRAKSLRR